MVDEDEREEAMAARGRTVLTKMPLKLVLSVCKVAVMTVRQRGGDVLDKDEDIARAALVGCEARITAAAPSAPIKSFIVAGPTGPSLYRCPQFGAV